MCAVCVLCVIVCVSCICTVCVLLYLSLNYFSFPICSHILYNFSHPNKYGVPLFDLSSDNEASVHLPLELSLSSDQLAVERVIVKVFTQYRCDVVITDRLRSIFKSKLYRMGRALQACGGTGRAKLINKWKQKTFSSIKRKWKFMCNCWWKAQEGLVKLFLTISKKKAATNCKGCSNSSFIYRK